MRRNKPQIHLLPFVSKLLYYLWVPWALDACGLRQPIPSAENRTVLPPLSALAAIGQAERALTVVRQPEQAQSLKKMRILLRAEPFAWEASRYTRNHFFERTKIASK